MNPRAAKESHAGHIKHMDCARYQESVRRVTIWRSSRQRCTTTCYRRSSRGGATVTSASSFIPAVPHARGHREGHHKCALPFPDAKWQGPRSGARREHRHRGQRQAPQAIRPPHAPVVLLPLHRHHALRPGPRVLQNIRRPADDHRLLRATARTDVSAKRCASETMCQRNDVSAKRCVNETMCQRNDVPAKRCVDTMHRNLKAIP